jgi:SHOCT-like protein
MSDETRRVLELVAQGKVTVDEADQLLRAMGAPTPEAGAAAAAPEDAERPKPRWLRINVHKSAKEGHHDKDVNIRVPIAIIKSGMRLGALIPGPAGDQFAARMREKGLDVDFSKLDAATVETMLKELSETNIQIDSGRAQVRITCE